MQAGKITAQGSAGTSSVWKCLQPCYPARSCLTFVTSAATPEGWTESESSQRVEERSFHSWPFEQQQLFCLCCQAINAGSPPHPPAAPGLEQLPAAPIRLPGPYLSQARVFSAGGTSPSSASSATAAFAGAGHCSLLSIHPAVRESRRSKHTWAGLLRGGSLLQATKLQQSCMASVHPPSAGRELRAVPPAPPPPGRNQLPSTLGKTRELHWCVLESSQQTCFPSLTFPCVDPLAASVPEGSGQLSCR